MERRLVAILAADMVGYSRLMGADEEGTIVRQRAHREALIDPEIASHGGRIVKTMGDGLLVEFPSVVDALKCAVAVQAGMAEREADALDDRRIQYRIGINLGDIVIDGDDILGDGVNVAARLEGLAEAGGICISDVVHQSVEGKLELSFADMGAQQVKNIARPVRAYQVLLSGTVESPAGELALPDKPSIAVLPFDNMSGDPEQEYFSDGLTEDLITALCYWHTFYVIARHSTFQYKGQSPDVRQVAQDLGVQYVLEGSIQAAGDRVRITAQLIDATTGGHLWAERYDGTVDDVFELQDEVGAKVVSALSVELTQSETESLERVHTHNLDAYELFVRAKATPYPLVPARIDSAREMFEQVIEMDPDFAGGYAGVSAMLGFASTFGHSYEAGVIDRAVDLARKAIELDETFGWSYTALGLALLQRGEIDAAVEAGRQAIARQPGDADAHAYHALVVGLAGNPEEGVTFVEHALQLNPQFVNGPYLNILGILQLYVGNYEAAVEALDENMNRQGPVGPPALCSMAAAYWALGDVHRATDILQRLTTGFPHFTITNWNLISLIHPAEARERVFKLMQDAGLPEASEPEDEPLPLPDKPSIAVLPFDNMSGDPEQEYFADGITEDIITELSKISGLFVIARHSAFTYKGKSITPKQVGRELGARCVLEGSVRKSGNRLRITAQLIDTATDHHLWAERYDRELEDIFAVQDEVARNVAKALAVTLKTS